MFIRLGFHFKLIKKFINISIDKKKETFILCIVMITKMELFKNKLQEKEIKPTYIRLKVLDYLEKNKVHPTAEVIYKALVKKIPTISRTSVYNTLNVFYEKGLVTPLFITGLKARFDSNISSHHHFLCVKCRQIIDLDIECSYFKKGKVKAHKITELHGYFKGICRDCLKKEKTEKKKIGNQEK